MHNFLHLHSTLGYINFLSDLSYSEVFIMLLASGHVIPVPEGVTLILLGYLAALGKGSLIGFTLVGIAAVVFFDVLMYVLSLESAKLAKFLSKRINLSLLERYAQAGDKKIGSLIIFSHFVPGWRFANPIIAGIARVSWKKFVPYTVLSACLYAPLYVLIGVLFKSKIVPLLHVLRSLNHYATPLLILVGLVILIVLIFENRKNVYNKNHAEK